MVKKARLQALKNSPIDCACVIHGTAYDWRYVDVLYSMLTRHFSQPIRLHVWTEPTRKVPTSYIRHDLVEWPGISGPRKSWWYKMQMFDPAHFQGRLLYFDLDVMIMQSLDWMLALDTRYFWAIRDFRHHFRGAWWGINSSCMVWDTERFAWIWRDFCANSVTTVTRRFQGDQDFLNDRLDASQKRYFNQDWVRSWRWEVKDGGMDFKKKVYKRPDAGSVIPPDTHIVIFHGQPKPHEIKDPVILQNWC